MTLSARSFPPEEETLPAPSPTNFREAEAPRRQTRALLLDKREVAPRHFEFRLRSASIARSARAGQFVHILPRACESEADESWSFDPLLRRAFSIMDIEDDEFLVLFRVEGRGTQTLARAVAGQWLDLIGPLGNGFSIEDLVPAHSALLVGGGVGVPPMVLTARELKLRGARATMLIGARTGADVLCESRFSALGATVRVATDDGSRGRAGRVDALLLEALESENNPVVLACGPYPMLRAVARLCLEKDVPCQVSLEENMPCGIGVCNGCVVPMISAESEAGDDYGRYRRICVNGPVCDAREIAWT